MNVMGGGHIQGGTCDNFILQSFNVHAEQFQVMVGSSVEQTGAVSSKLRISNLWESTP